MPVPELGVASAGSAFERDALAVRLWSISSADGQETLIDQQVSGPHIPTAQVRIVTLDSDSRVPRTRLDQPFRVEIEANGLLDSRRFPKSAANLLVERQLHPDSTGSQDAPPGVCRSVLIEENGKTVLRFAASNLTAGDPTKASGEERFVVHALNAGECPCSQIASGVLQVMPVASAEIRGLKSGDHVTGSVSNLEIALLDLYPVSTTRLQLFPGRGVNGVQGITIRTVILDLETCANRTFRVNDLASRIPRDGTYTLAAVSDTIYGSELLCAPVTFEYRRGSEAKLQVENTPR